MPLRKINRALLTVGLGACLGGPVLADAQTDRLQALERKLDISLQLIDRLSARLAELERGNAVPAATALAAPAAVAQTITTLQDSVNQLTESVNRRPADQGLPVHGFVDVGGAWSYRSDPVKLRGFNGGTLDLYLTPQFSERVKGLVELAAECGDDGHLALDMERLQLGYVLNDGLTLGVHGFRSTVKAYDANGGAMGSTRLTMAGAYVGYDENDWEVVGEYYRFSNTELDTGDHRSNQAGFLQVGRTFGLLTPFFRWEKASLDRGDLYFARQESGRSYTRQSVGLRYALDPKTSFKLELSNTREAAAELIDDTGSPDPFAARNYRRASFQYSAAF